ncbi:MAG: hybrid sensor histidine kinase/response regulator [Myxococcales bacterium]|nr:hybrid sensor histidine kinase/response regulator [Myxococcales bacterium]
MGAALAAPLGPTSSEGLTPPEVETHAARILLADDDKQVRRTVGRVLRKRGFEVIEAVDGLEATEAAKLSPPDLALVDLRMPHKDGFDVVRELKTANPRLPVLVLSGWDDAEDRVQAFDVGADDFIAKPVYMKELLRRIDAFERTRRAYLELQALNEHADHLRLFAAEAAALLAHDLNNGLSIASANMQFIDEELRESHKDPELVEASSAGRRALRRMIGLVANFVDISRLEDAALQVVRFPTRVGDLLRSTGQIHETSRGDIEGIEVVCDTDLVCEIDPMLTERVLHNLLNNATRYVDTGGRIHMEARLEDGDETLFISVANTGSVIPRDKRAGLFEKYGKAGDGKSQRGMGLYFCRLACEAHGGSIGVEDTDRFATLFSIRLSLATATPIIGG